jgi:catechol 2,3-dioxygenase-like lactoylglutathione lyase family enzyme
MIRVSQLISRSRTERCLPAKLADITHATVIVRDLARSVDFYTRVFGFRLAEQAEGPCASALMTGSGNARLTLHEHCDKMVSLTHRHWGFVVNDLESVRDTVWDLGVKVAKDNGEPDQIHRGPGGHSLYIQDPDGNEIELIEPRRHRCRALLRFRDRSCVATP